MRHRVILLAAHAAATAALLLAAVPAIATPPSCRYILDTGQASGDGVYTIDPDGPGGLAPFSAYCDMTTDGGGWTLVLNYLHQGGTTPPVQVRTNDLPLLGSDVLGTDESGTQFLGHASNNLFALFNASEVRFFGKTSGHSQVIHFKSDLAACISYFETGEGSCSGILGNFTTFPDHSASLPGSSDSFGSDQGDLALATEPFYENVTRHWNCDYTANERWEVDDYPNSAANSTIHRVWVRQAPTMFVTSTSPAENALNVAPASDISIDFSEDLNFETVDPTSIAVRGSFTGDRTGVWSNVPLNNATLDPASDFLPGERVMITVSPGVFSAVGAPTVPYTWEFVTAAGAGPGTFVNSGQALGSSFSWGLALGDVDGDGDLDAYVGNLTSVRDRLWLNDGSGQFTDSGQALSFSYSWDVALGDVDGDHDLDAVLAYSSGANQVWLNNAGTFTDSGQALGSSDSKGVALGDLDGDGDLDAFFANWNDQANRVWLNNGAGTFSDSGQALGSSTSSGVALGDVDADGDLDAFVTNNSTGQTDRVWLNDGTGGFSDSGQALGAGRSQNPVLGDLDGDGDLDAFVTSWGAVDRVSLNDGTGTFSDSNQSSPTLNYFVALGDVDGDGDLDALVTTSAGLRVSLNSGGTFSDSGQSPAIASAQGIALGDLDGDGDLDAFVAVSADSPNQVWFNEVVNTPPVALPDFYGTYVGTTLNIPAPGVLLNDFDPEMDPLNVTEMPPDMLTSQGGTVTVLADGSFTYTPPQSPLQVLDTFTYMADDGTDFSAPALVTIDVRTNILASTFVDELNTDGDCSLREAIQAANTNLPVDACPAGAPGTDTIDLLEGTYALDIKGSGEDGNLTGDLDITESLALVGIGPGPTIIDGGGPGVLDDRIFEVHPTTASVQLHDLTVTGGSFTVTGSGRGFGGGGIVNGGGSLALFDSTISGNEVLANAVNSNANGGGIYNEGGVLTVDGSTVSGNQVSDAGNGGKMLVGGGVCVGSNTYAWFLNSTISGNSVVGTGAGSDGYGGGIGVGSTLADADLNYVTIYGNSVETLDIAQGGGIATLNPTTFSYTLSSIIAGNSATAHPDFSGQSGSFGFNLVENPEGTLGLTSEDLSYRDARLGPLADYGGPTQTHAPLSESPVIELASDLEPPFVDQRGQARPAGLRPDAGAYEEQSPPLCGSTGWAMAVTVGYWHMISLPCDPLGASIETLFGDDLDPLAYGADWAVVARLYEELYAPPVVDDGYQMLLLTDTIQPGQGVWFKTLVAPPGGVIDIDGGPVSTPLTVPLEVDSAGGPRFNLVGNPLEVAYSWPDVLVECGGSQAVPVGSSPPCIDTTMWRYDEVTDYQPYSVGVPGQEGTLFRFDAIWVLTLGSATVSLVFDGDQIPVDRGKTTRVELAPDEWTIRFIAEGDALYDPGNQVGQLRGAACDRDARDLLELPPRNSRCLTLVFPHPEWEAEGADFATDFRPVECDDPVCRGEWHFEVRTSEVDGPVTLRWESHGKPGVLGTGRLVDEQSGEMIPTSPGASYTFTPTSGLRRFTFTVDPNRPALAFPDGSAPVDTRARPGRER